jgi:excisionase family DNA binding protein
MTDQQPLLYGAKCIAEFLGVTPRVVYHLIEDRRIPFIKIGRTVAARPASLLRALEEMESAAA